MSSSNKRLNDSDEPPAKKKATLSQWLNVPPPPPYTPGLVVSSFPITDRQSTFIAFATSANTAADAISFQKHIRALIDSRNHPSKADHEYLGWRCMVTKQGKNGLGGVDDWTVKTGGDDDGEQRSRSTITELLEQEGCIDVAVVVSRYYGGIMLGPKRFEIIRDVTRQAIHKLKTAMLIPHLITRLQSLDEAIAILIEASTSNSPTTANGAGKGKGKAVEYSLIEDFVKLERLIKAREKRLEMLEQRKRTENIGDTADVAVVVDVEQAATRTEAEDTEETVRQQKEDEVNAEAEAELALIHSEDEVEFGFDEFS